MTTTNKSIDNTRYFYIRSEHGNRIAACVAYRLAMTPQGNGELSYAIATVHPGDAISKELARTISSGRLAKRSQTIAVPAGSKPLELLIESIASHYLDHSGLTASESRRHDTELHALNLSREVCRLAAQIRSMQSA